MAKRIVGIDLGTTNTVVFHTAADAASAPEPFPVPQVVELGECAERPVLPSFLFLPGPGETPAGALDTPWAAGADSCVGELARRSAPGLPGRVVASAKSWLCASGADRRGKILPWAAPGDARRVSPVDAAEAVLSHVRDAWNHRHAGRKGMELERQDVVLTVPASFDPAARELTVEAARRCGLDPVLLEEPQAAFYAWIDSVGDAWRKAVRPGDTILVCDIGGGTTDFSLIQVADQGGELALERVAVGRHILLGGDNMDLAVARMAAAKLEASRKMALDVQQLVGLSHACREAKEAFMAVPGAPPRRLTVLGRGSGVVGGSISVEVTAAEVGSAVLDGFFPPCSLGDAPESRRRSGLRATGLDYEQDPAITRHLAQFLSSNCPAGRLPSKVLFNGGVVKAPRVVERLAALLSEWAGAPVDALAGADPDMAVAMGAACYGRVRAGNGIRIKAGTAKSYYVGVEPPLPAVPGFHPPLGALCVAPKGLEEGCGNSVPVAGLALLVGERTSFRFFASGARPGDAPGDFIEDALRRSDLEELPPLAAELPPGPGIPPGALIPVSLRCDLSETGTLTLWCESAADAKSRWKLEFDLRV